MKNILLVAALATSLFSCKKGETYRCDIQISEKETRTILSDSEQPQSGLANTEAFINKLYPGKPYLCRKISRREFDKLMEELDSKANNP